MNNSLVCFKKMNLNVHPHFYQKCTTNLLDNILYKKKFVTSKFTSCQLFND